ncbi:MAG: SUF system NifU family Fe-S cluster assembly protein [Rhodobacterales bacterium]|nr:SUF system NifU family Fe-S cluster assembly protein [Rhodobacterales bacterium]
MSDLLVLYQEMILDHGRKPRNFGRCDPASHHADGYNPLCGDRFTVTLQVDADVITDIQFEGSGCAISTASASLMTEALKGRAASDVPGLFEAVHGLCTGDAPNTDKLGKLVVFGGVANFPMRVKCATLPWHTLKAALKGEESVSTE